MKKYFKKVLAVLLVATSFNVLPIIDKTCSSVLTYADSESEQNQDIANVMIDGFPFVHVKDTIFCIEKKIYDENPRLYTKSSLNQAFQKAKEKIRENLGLDYPDEAKCAIFVKEKLSDDTIAGRYYPDSKQIEIRKDVLFDKQTLPHEMTHALLRHLLGKRRNLLNLGIDEGLATQVNKLGDYEAPSSMDLLFLNHYSSDISKKNDYYVLHHHLIHDWIEAEGKEVVKKFIEKVKNGEDSVQAFLNLGGDKLLGENIVKLERLMYKCKIMFRCTILVVEIIILINQSIQLIKQFV